MRQRRSSATESKDIPFDRIVIGGEPAKTLRLVKFISQMDVHETSYEFKDGLGLRSEREMNEILAGCEPYLHEAMG